MDTTTSPTTGSREYARLLLRLHELDPRGEAELPELDAICDQMDRPWVQMNGQERSRVKGLSQDLYALADGRHGVAMSLDERERWAEKAREILSPAAPVEEVDTALKFLRESYPEDLPPFTIAFFQAKCWERLGEDDIALTFMKEAERLEPRQAISVLWILRRLGRTRDAAECAERIVSNPQSTGEELCHAAETLLSQVRLQMSPVEAKPILQRVVAILERSLRVLDKTPKENWDIPDADRYIISMLGYCHKQLGNTREAVRWYSDGLARYSGDGELLSLRAFALIDTDPAKALDDCRRAVEAGTASIWPYYFLAWDAIQRASYAESWRLCLIALEKPAGPKAAMARLYEWLGIAQAELDQPIEQVLDYLRRAENLDPESPRIRSNRMRAEAIAKVGRAASANGWTIDGRASGEQALREAYPNVPPTGDRFGERSERTLAALLRSA